MIHRLEIENFYSIRHPQVIDLTTTYDLENEPYRFAPAFTDAEIKVPKVITLFGANAAGKSTVLRAIAFLAWFVGLSFRNSPGGTFPYSKFLNRQAFKKNTRLAACFAGNSDLEHLDKPAKHTCKYEYELVLAIDNNNANQVISETLSFWPAGKKTRLIERDEEGNVIAHRAFSPGGYRHLKGMLRQDASVIATLAQFKHPLATYFLSISGLINSNIVVQRQETYDAMTALLYHNNPNWIKGLNEIIDKVDFGIKSVEIKSSVQDASPLFLLQHSGLDESLGLPLESHGTRQFIQIFPFIFQTLETGGLAVIDDMDLSIHPILLPEIVRWFHDPERNKNNAQLWMTCQSPSLLDELFKEEVLFCEKDFSGCTSVYGLKDIKDVRRKDNYYQKYLSGVYGGVPQIG